MNRLTAASMGLDRGKITWKNTRTSLQPSMRAASSNSRGTE